MLYPQTNAFRAVFDLSGFWQFRPDPEDLGRAQGWFSAPFPEGDAFSIAVPGAWNEQLAERGLMNFVGKGWYQVPLELPRHAASGQRIWLHVAAADHSAEIWLNGRRIGAHRGGFLPFELELTDAWEADGPNQLTICVDSSLSMHTIPQDVSPSNPMYDGSAYERRHLFPPTRFDFFPYGGLTRSVRLCTTPARRIEAVRIDSRLDGDVRVAVRADVGRVEVLIREADGRLVGSGQATIEHGSGRATAKIDNVRPWSPSDPYLYRAEVCLLDGDGRAVDRYDESFGIREIRVEQGRLLLNEEPLYLVGYGKHEDFPIVGRGQFRAGYLRDFELMRWSGANSFRTSHYPYDEEMIRLSDRLGFLVIDEVPAVSLGLWSDDFEELAPLLASHKESLSALIERDANRPCVISWSVVNEAGLWAEEHGQSPAARRYFREIYEHVKELDESRPVLSIIIPAHSPNDVALEACDLIGINRYYAWYTEPGDLEHAARKLEDELDELYRVHGKPILLTEFGVDTLPGAHSTTAQFFTEEFQAEFLETYCRVADAKPYCAGTHVWNFADFRTPQHFRRVVHNLKGVFTRSREPKRAAFFLRDYWRTLHRVAETHRVAGRTEGTLVADVKKPVNWEAASLATHHEQPNR